MSHNANDTKVFNHYKSGLWNVGSYQVAGIPYISGTYPSAGPGSHTSGSIKRFEFPNVAKSVTVVNRSSNDIRISFVPWGTTPVPTAGVTTGGPFHAAVGSFGGTMWAGMHYVLLDSDEDTMTFNTKCKEIYISGSHADCTYMVTAELTGIPAGEMFTLTGPGHDE